MNTPEREMELDIQKAIQEMHKKSDTDKALILKELLDKYIEKTTSDHSMGPLDLLEIIQNAKNNFSTQKMPIYLGERKKKVDPSDLPNLCVVESTISYLNKHHCLRRIAKFDKRDDSF